MKGTTIFWIVFGLVLLGGAVFAWTYVEWVEEEVDRGYSLDARRNDFLAAERFLAKHGIETEDVTGATLLDDLPPADDALLMSAPREALSARRRDALVAWVERGGLLMVVAHSVYDHEVEASRDPLLDALGVFLIAPEEEDEVDDEVDGDDAESNVPDVEQSFETQAEELAESLPGTLGEAIEQALGLDACREDEDRLDTLRLGPGDDDLARVELDHENELAVYEERLDEVWFSPKRQVMLLPVEAGQVIAVTSIAPFRNKRIHCHDHAWFLWHTFEGRPKVWMMHDPDVPSLADLAVANLPLTSWGGLGLILLACVTYSLRFDLPTRESAAPRREHLEHVQASVTFHFRKGGFGALVKRLRDDLLARAPRDHEKWASRAGLSRDALAAALSEHSPRSRRAIIERTAWMLRLRKTK